ncbi:MAG: low molecular weight phosphatase family protein [Propionibacteriaceae bacterium]
MTNPVVLFVCQSNGGKSAMAAALMRSLGENVDVREAGIEPAAERNALSVESLAAIDVVMDGAPQPLDLETVKIADRIIVLGYEAKVPGVPGQKALVERWIPADPNNRGLEGRERMDALRDDIFSRVKALHDDVTGKVAPVVAPPAGGGGGGGCCGSGGCC